MDLNTLSSMGWLIPAWILGAPLLVAVVQLMTTPKGGHSANHSDLPERTRMPGTAGRRDTQVPPR